ncbi:MAG: prepilin-type N-terminal cleavage/methylation domain-containing protein [Planctomycetia bacterium]|nr:prepilin-type N-terminal cleavage/methylation domain-containing protein [Planctomycetia bacterium]
MRSSTGFHRRKTPGLGFTLVELMVVLVIISMLAALTLAGLAGARQRAKIDKTRSTIRKIHEIVMPQYESYLSRRVRVGGTTTRELASSRLQNLRLLQALEMPDQWADVLTTGGTGSLTAIASSKPWAVTAPVRQFAAVRTALMNTGTADFTRYESAECLALIVMRGGFNPDASEVFRNDEVGDLDSNGAPEFWDGWGRPIAFVRWPAGFASPVQVLNASENPDPMDPMKISGDYGLTPLIFSPGPDDPLISGGPTYGGVVSSGTAVSGGWYAKNLLSITGTSVSLTLSGSIADPAAARDNVTNHDLIKK